MSHDEQSDGDPHGECAAEIRRLERDLTAARARVKELEASLRHAMQALVHQDGRLIDPDCEGCQQARALLVPSPETTKCL